MHYKCSVRNLSSGETAITAKADEAPLALQKGSVLVEVERAIVDVDHLARVSSSEPLQRDCQPLEWCSLVGRVIQVDHEVNGFQNGDRIGAIGPVANRVILPAQECLELQSNVNPDQAACWALLVALIRFAGKLHLEIGESVIHRSSPLRAVCNKRVRV